MAKTIILTLTEDEADMLIDALEADRQGYLEAVEEARKSKNRADVTTFGEAAERIQALIGRIQPLID